MCGYSWTCSNSWPTKNHWTFLLPATHDSWTISLIPQVHTTCCWHTGPLLLVRQTALVHMVKLEQKGMCTSHHQDFPRLPPDLIASTFCIVYRFFRFSHEHPWNTMEYLRSSIVCDPCIHSNPQLQFTFFSTSSLTAGCLGFGDRVRETVKLPTFPPRRLGGLAGPPASSWPVPTKQHDHSQHWQRL